MQQGMHYCFFTSGICEGNASFVRLRELGNELASRQDSGIRISYVVDDTEHNRKTLKVHPSATVLWNSSPRSVAQLWKRRGLLRRAKPDFVHVLNPYAKAFAALAMRSRDVQLIGDWDEWPARRPYPMPRRALERFLDRWMRHSSSRVLVASKYLREEFRKLGTESIYIPYATYLHAQEDGQSPYSVPTAVYMGTLYPAYDHDLVFDALRLLKSRGLTPAFSLLGDGPDMAKWREYVQRHQLHNATLHGMVTGPELWRRLRHARVLLFPIRETLLNLCRCPSKTFAYVQAKRPVIANKVGEVAEVLGGKAFRYVEPTAESFADAIADAMQSPAAEADVEYDLSSLTWSARAETLLRALGAAQTPQPALAPTVGRGEASQTH